MNKYALLTKASPTTWEVFQVIRLADSEEDTSLANILNLSISNNETVAGLEVSNVNTESLKRGAIWDGSSFSGGLESDFYTQEIRNKRYAFTYDNKLTLVLTAIEGSAQADMYQAAFAGEVSIKKIEDESTIVAAGYIWDGINFNAPA